MANKGRLSTEERLFGMEGRHVLIIGGGQGMGEATARLLARLGCNLTLLDLEQERAERVCQAVRAEGIKAWAIAADVTDEAQVVAAMERIEREFAPLDAMAAIVGMAGWSKLAEMTTETWDRDHNRNLRYFFIAARELARSLLARGAPGSIVAVSSVDGLRSAQNHGAYGAAKAGLVNLVRTMAAEWTPDGIRVNCVAPGAIVTPRIPLGPEEQERAAMALVPMQRRGSTEDIARAIAFFLSDLSPYVSGQTLAVDGGYLAKGGFSIGTPRVSSQGTLGVDDAKA
ncbi:SDR family NAD(P)-dependent oxidoreductase [Novosphingobium sp. M1R2S20]|uniref:SDR family NAD(P)-dependent oxidoreductase n=1 Tax=Novosphingobium rhizovicinum TaxID=3228928 RepID=A0ABV3RAL0_9SPHN